MKSLSRLLAFLMTLALLVPLAACGKETPATPAITSAADTETTLPAETELKPDLPEKDFNGRDFRVQSVTYDPNSYTTIFAPEELTGEIVKDALYNRNLAVAQQFNVKFVATEDSYNNNYSRLREMALAEDDALEMIMVINRNAFSSSVDGYLTNVSLLKYLDLDKPWYSKDINDSMTIAGKLFFAYSDECLQMFESAAILMFNKDMMTDLGLDLPYKLVDEGKWTWDTFHDYAAAGLRDVNGDGAYTADDCYGVISHTDFYFPSFWIGADTLSVAKDKDDIPYFNIPGNERWNAAMEYSVKLLKEDLVCLESAGKRTEAVQTFAERGSLFCLSTLGRMQITREMEDDMGILPLPKYDAAQEKYRSRVIDGWLHVVPASVTDPEYVGVIMEALAYESYKNVFPSYYDNFVSYKILRDRESIEMMDLIKNTRMMDMGDVQLFDTIRSKYQSAVEQKSENFASLTASIQPAAEKAIADAVAKIKELE